MFGCDRSNVSPKLLVGALLTIELCAPKHYATCTLALAVAPTGSLKVTLDALHCTRVIESTGRRSRLEPDHFARGSALLRVFILVVFVVSTGTAVIVSDLITRIVVRRCVCDV